MLTARSSLFPLLIVTALAVLLPLYHHVPPSSMLTPWMASRHVKPPFTSQPSTFKLSNPFRSKDEPKSPNPGEQNPTDSPASTTHVDEDVATPVGSKDRSMISRLFGAFRPAASTSAHATVPTTNTAIQAQNHLRNMATNATNGATAAASPKPDIITVASGCFWGTEHIYREHYAKGKGLLDAKVGFIGGKDSHPNPSYEEVCTGRTGHAEATQIKFDPTKVSYAELVEFFYRTHDPTTLNRQGNDVGTQYRSALFAHSEEQLEVAKKVTEEVQAKHFTPKGSKIVTQLELRPADKFFVADEYHQEYLYKNKWGYQCPTHRLWW